MFTLPLETQSYNKKRSELKVLRICTAMLMMMSQILKSMDFTKTQKSRYFENKTSFLFQTKKFINCASRATLWQKIVL